MARESFEAALARMDELQGRCPRGRCRNNWGRGGKMVAAERSVVGRDHRAAPVNFTTLVLAGDRLL